MKKIIIVTGGAGFVGSNLISFLLNKTKFQIISLDNYSSGTKNNHVKDKRVKYIRSNTKFINKHLFSYKKTAEIVILDERKKWKFTEDSIKSNSLNSPFIGEELIGRIEFTISKNKIYSRTKLDI